jgi:hypothetical protein
MWPLQDCDFEVSCAVKVAPAKILMQSAAAADEALQ